MKDTAGNGVEVMKIDGRALNSFLTLLCRQKLFSSLLKMT